MVRFAWAHASILVVAVGVIAACSGDEPSGNSAVDIVGGIGKESGALSQLDCTTSAQYVPCTTDAQCDDHLWCNGNETCVSGRCQSSCANPCGTLICDESELRCNQCYVDSDCDGGMPGHDFCRQGVCVHGSTRAVWAYGGTTSEGWNVGPGWTPNSGMNAGGSFHFAWDNASTLTATAIGCNVHSWVNSNATLSSGATIVSDGPFNLLEYAHDNTDWKAIDFNAAGANAKNTGLICPGAVAWNSSQASFTVTAFVNQNGTTTPKDSTLDTVLRASGLYYLAVQAPNSSGANGGAVQLGVWNPTSGSYMTATSGAGEVRQNEWHELRATYVATTGVATLYVDERQVYSTTLASRPSTNMAGPYDFYLSDSASANTWWGRVAGAAVDMNVVNAPGTADVHDYMQFNMDGPQDAEASGPNHTWDLLADRFYFLGTTTSGSATITSIQTTSVTSSLLNVGAAIVGPGIPGGTTIAAVNQVTPMTVTLSQAATASAAGVYLSGLTSKNPNYIPRANFYYGAVEGSPASDPTNPAAFFSNNVYSLGLSTTGANQFVATYATPLKQVTQLTVEAWIKRNVDTGASENLFVGSALMDINVNASDKLVCQFQDSVAPTLKPPAVSTTSIAVGKWYHVLCSIDGYTTKVWINGVNEASANYTTLPHGFYANYSGNLSIGYSASGFQGEITGIRLWDRARAPDITAQNATACQRVCTASATSATSCTNNGTATTCGAWYTVPGCANNLDATFYSGGTTCRAYLAANAACGGTVGVGAPTERTYCYDTTKSANSFVSVDQSCATGCTAASPCSATCFEPYGDTSTCGAAGDSTTCNSNTTGYTPFDPNPTNAIAARAAMNPLGCAGTLTNITINGNAGQYQSCGANGWIFYSPTTGAQLLPAATQYWSTSYTYFGQSTPPATPSANMVALGFPKGSVGSSAGISYQQFERGVLAYNTLIGGYNLVGGITNPIDTNTTTMSNALAAAWLAAPSNKSPVGDTSLWSYSTCSASMTGDYGYQLTTRNDAAGFGTKFTVRGGASTAYRIQGHLFADWSTFACNTGANSHTGTSCTPTTGGQAALGWPIGNQTQPTGLSSNQAFEFGSCTWTAYQSVDVNMLGGGPNTPNSSTVHYNEVYQVQSHNTFDADIYGSGSHGQATAGEVLDAGVRALEYDLWWDTRFTAARWKVYHARNGNNCGGHDQNGDLRQCMRDIISWHKLQPKHEVITIFLDSADDQVMGSDAAAGPNPLVPDLDSLLDAEFGASSIYKPANFLARCSPAQDLQTAVHNCGWPTLDELRGKFLFVTTGTLSIALLQYRVLTTLTPFVARGWNDSTVHSNVPDGDVNVIFFNIGPHAGESHWYDTFGCGVTNWWCNPDANALDSAINVWNAGYMSRVFRFNIGYVPGTAYQTHPDGVNHRVHFAATNDYENSTMVSKSAAGYPFQCLSPYTCNTDTWVEDLRQDNN